MSKVIVVGAGAAGMMAAIAAAEDGHQVMVYEKNEKAGKKLFITGKGRCNLTNACDMETLFQNVVTNQRFLYSAFYGFDNQAVIRFFEESGLKMKTERGERVFPASDHASDVIAALERRMAKCQVKVRLRQEIKSLDLMDGNVKGVYLKSGEHAAADAVILATGGLSYPLTGSTGDGYRMAREAGHGLTETSPALVPLETKEAWCKSLQGLSLKNVAVSLQAKGKKPYYEGFGEMLFTHYGISGPLILSASSYYAFKQGEDTILSLDLKPALTVQQLDLRVRRDFEENGNKQFKNILGGLFPSKLIPVMISLSGILPDKKVNEISKEERNRFVQLIKHMEMTIVKARDYNEAIITRGGIPVKEINPSTMESKKVKGLYFAGEIVDLDALTGGFNLQVAWSTGYLAGGSIEKI